MKNFRLLFFLSIAVCMVVSCTKLMFKEARKHAQAASVESFIDHSQIPNK